MLPGVADLSVQPLGGDNLPTPVSIRKNCIEATGSELPQPGRVVRAAVNPDRLDYTIIGRGVNIASRLESLATPGEILISCETCAHVEGKIAGEEKGEVKVKGIAYPVATCQVVGTRDATAQPSSQREVDWAALAAKEPEKLSETERREAIAHLTQALEGLARTGNKADAAK